jgi:hypothetical protein
VEEVVFMERQCAWCLRLMDEFGEPVSTPQPKQYKISHGMCRSCGSHWLAQALLNTVEQDVDKKKIVPVTDVAAKDVPVTKLENEYEI